MNGKKCKNRTIIYLLSTGFTLKVPKTCLKIVGAGIV